MAALISEALPKFTAETLRSAAKQSERCAVVPPQLRQAIETYLQEKEEPHMKRNVLQLSESFNNIKDVNLQLATSTSKELVEHPLKSMESSKRWKIKSLYGETGLKYREDQTVAYVASRMPAVFSACRRVLSEVRRRVPGFSPHRVLDFGAGTGSAMWAVREVWPQSLERFNLIEPSQSMQRAGQSLIKDLKDLPLIQSYSSIQSLTQSINKAEREHDLVIASYVLGEIPSLKDRITIVRQLWDLTQDILVLVEPGTPHGANIISQMRSHILWKEKRKNRKSEGTSNGASIDFMTLKSDAHIVAPCPHDGACPLDKTGKYCHFVQRLERTTSQRAYKRSKGQPLRGYEDEKFCFIAFRRGQRPRESWPLDGVKFDTLKEQHDKRKPEDFEIDFDDQLESEAEIVPEEEDPVFCDSDITNNVNEDEDGEINRADLGGGWGRIIYSPQKRGKRVEMDVCRAINREGSDGAFERIVVTQGKNPALHKQAKGSQWGDLWPF
ncbi:uncharacterized protein LOC108205856 isoform X1 [Daucus carota subsp. sativus]|uniref:Uncharacterized protein n=1 Tax=Daucus carota subsp. sativus TaxID=79200 RepID=A0A166DTL3_DAUCS|nr:PREDICTED: methyltransferase-like protein 17, mitochondrial isoform X1 [Daucus carota subsp. sativus]